MHTVARTYDSNVHGPSGRGRKSKSERKSFTRALDTVKTDHSFDRKPPEAILPGNVATDIELTPAPSASRGLNSCLRRLGALLCQLLLIAASFHLASHNFAHHSTDLLVKAFCFSVQLCAFWWFKQTISTK